MGPAGEKLMWSGLLEMREKTRGIRETFQSSEVVPDGAGQGDGMQENTGLLVSRSTMNTNGGTEN